MRKLLTILSFLLLVNTVDAQLILGVVASSKKVEEAGGISLKEADDFKTATGITSTPANAIDSLVYWLKDSGLWDKLQVIYPFVGGTSNSHRYNLKDTLTFKITYGGNNNWVHSSSGLGKSNTTGYANTGWNPYEHVTSPNYASSIGVYSLTDENNAGSNIGALETISGSDYYFQIYPRLSGSFYAQLGNNNVSQSMSVGASTGWFFTSRSGANTQYLQRNSTQNTFSNLGTTGIPNLNVYIGTQNKNGTEAQGSKRTIAFAILTNQSLTQAEGLKLYNIIQKFQTLLGREV